ncbi:MAG TPA: ABC transporter permease [Mucilaginibacter sp.]|jgi:sodium transport system permease protein
MHPILTVFKKELKITLRDRKTLISSIVIPAVFMPLIILGVIKLQQYLNEGQNNRQLKIAMVNAPSAMDTLFKDPKITVLKQANAAIAADSVKEERYDAALVFDEQVATRSDNAGTSKVLIYYKSTDLGLKQRIMPKLERYKTALVSARLKKLDLSDSLLSPIVLHEEDLASKKELISVLVGGFLPYIFIIFCFLGCMYPTLDLITGEKEKGTIETLLTVPVSRFDILAGKILAIATIGLCAAFMTISGMFLTLRLMNGIPTELLIPINDILTPRFVVMLFGMLTPLSLFFAGLLSAIAIRAGSFKEAQSYVTPMTFIVIIPAMIALFPGVRLSWQTAWIPILNIALATKEIVAGKISMIQYTAIVATLIVFALIALRFSVRQFSKEGNILK